MSVEDVVWKRVRGEGYFLDHPKAMANGGEPITISKEEGYSLLYRNYGGIGYRISCIIGRGVTPEGEPLKDVTPSRAARQR